MPKFIVKAGRHHQNGQTFEKGQVVDSPHDLVKAFPGKFKKITSKQDVIDFQSEQEEEVAASLPHAAVVGTDLEREAPEGEDPEDKDSAPVTGEDSTHGERDRAQEEEPPPRSRTRRKKRGGR